MAAFSMGVQFEEKASNESRRETLASSIMPTGNLLNHKRPQIHRFRVTYHLQTHDLSHRLIRWQTP